MKLVVIIVSYNVKYYVEQCLDSLSRALKNIDSEIYVVDNHSKDGTCEYLARRFPGVHIVESNHNLGFARANNIAIRQSESEYVLLLNPDTFVGEHTIEEAVAFMDAHHNAGGVGVKMYNSDGTVAMESRRGLPTPLVSLKKMLGFSEEYYMSSLPWDKPAQIDIISGAFCLLRRKALDKVGLLDEDFFMYGEDIDLSYRLKKGGFENWYLPLPILHYKGESTHKSSFRYVHVFYQAMLIFFRKHYGHMSFFITFPIKAAIYFRAMIALVKMLWDRMRLSLGFYDGSKDIPDFVFIGSEAMNEECMKIARRKGLTAEYHVADNENVRKFIEDFQPKRQSVLFVFDINTFEYRKVIELMNACKVRNAQLGLFSPAKKIIITQFEIIL